ncbi:MAG: SprT-like domain-containing protein [Gammaproteobacteria bacterium]|nr:SprT-like domain-containing protein [Gammaproteobacteria bacterium]
MPNCDERMRIGTPVMWIDTRGRGERGHVVEDGRTYATVLREDGARLRIRWENLLEEKDRAPLRTIVTDLDRARVRFEVGDDVVFTTRDGSTKRGTIEKLNAKRARVHCSEQRWDVPYVALRRRDGPDRARGVERLAEVAREARALMDAHGLEEWTLRFGAAQRRLGACLERPKIIEIARWHAAHGEPRQVTDTVLHEIAHALAGANAGHGPAWKAVARRIGATPRARTEEKEEGREHGAATKAKLRAGMRVSFRARGGRRLHGTIAKMNPKRARVECAEGVFLVPYGLLDREDGAS